MEHKNGIGGCGDPQYTYEGAVLGMFERNGYDDSDFYAIVWDAAHARIRSVCYASTCGWSYHNNATVDATPEVLEAAEKYAMQEWVVRYTEQAAQDAACPLVGRMVESTTKRGKNVGIEGEVRWYGEDRYNRFSVPKYRVGVRVDGERIFDSCLPTQCEC